MFAFGALAMLARGGSSALVGPAAYGYEYGDFAYGMGKRLTLGGFPTTVRLLAESGPSGGRARGEFSVSTTTPDGVRQIRGHVKCLTVQGNRAAARGPVQDSNDPAIPVGSPYQIQVTDNGKPGRFRDTNLNFFGFGPDDKGCPIIPATEVPIEEGDFVVHDG
jgi:hypothetical protein